MGFIPSGITQFRWFSNEFNKANGLQLLPRIISRNPTRNQAVMQLVIDQIIFPNASRCIEMALNCSYHCFQVLVDMGPPSTEKLPNAGMTPRASIADLHDALIWVLNHSTAMRYSSDFCIQQIQLPQFATIAIQKVRLYGTLEGEVRSFVFVREMTQEEWDQWVAKLKTVVMAVKLGGLKATFTHRVDRLLKDVEGICSRIPL
jgi:hypothetical protein